MTAIIKVSFLMTYVFHLSKDRKIKKRFAIECRQHAKSQYIE